MFNSIHKLLNSVIFTKPSVHYIAPKALNLYFKNAINPSYTMINMTDYSSLALECVSDKVGENNVFKLNINVAKKSTDIIQSISVASFETRKEAEEALIILKNKLYSPAKTGVKFMTATVCSVLFLFFILSLLQGMSAGSQPALLNSNIGSQQLEQLQQLQQLQQPSATGNVNGNVTGNMPSPSDSIKAAQALQQARQQADKIIEDGTRGNAGQPAVVQEAPQDPAMKNFMDSLGQ
jgi:hypothetical protein